MISKEFIKGDLEKCYTEDEGIVLFIYSHPIVSSRVLVERHEYHIDRNAKCDEQVDERIKNEEGKEFRQLEPEAAAVPHTENIAAGLKVGNNNVLQLGPFLILLIENVYLFYKNK